MPSDGPAAFQDHFQALTDPRVERTRKHPLINIAFIAVCCYEYVTIGGCAATRSAGQASTGYGRIDELVVGARLAAPAGDLDLRAQPASAAGPELRRVVVGSEGVLGAITRVAVRVRPAPEVTRYEGWMFPGFGAGAEALRRLEQGGASPDVARLSDEAETRLGLGMSGLRGVRAAALQAYLRTRGVAGGALAIVGWAGPTSRCACAARRPSRRCVTRAASLWGSRRGARGCAPASRGPTCATS